MLISKWSQRADPSVQESLANSSACPLMALCRALQVTVGCERSRRRPHPPHPNTHKHMALCHRVHDTCPERQANFVSRPLLGPIICSCRSGFNAPFFVQWRNILFIWMCSSCSDSTSQTVRTSQLLHLTSACWLNIAHNHVWFWWFSHYCEDNFFSCFLF